MGEGGQTFLDHLNQPIANIGVPSWQAGLALAVNDTYNFSNSTLFCAQIASYYRDYAIRVVLPQVQWLDGYVPSLHQSGSTGIISTRIASKLISGLTKQVTGEKLVYRLKSKKEEKAMQDLKFISDWGKQNKIHRAVKAAVGYALGLGTSLLKMNKRSDQTIWWEGVRFDNCFYLADFTGKVLDAKFLIRGYTDTRKKEKTQYYLVEHRFWKEYDGSISKLPNGQYVVAHKKGEKVAMVEYTVHRAISQSLNNLLASHDDASSVHWQEIPAEIRKMIKHDYSVIRIDEPQELGFRDLGVVALLNGEGDLSIPTGYNFGEGMIIGIIDDLITYEVATSYLLRDMYNGKGTVYVPKSMSLGDIAGGMPQVEIAGTATTGEFRSDGTNTAPLASPSPNPFGAALANNPFANMDGSKFERIPGMSPEDQSAVVQQFEIRAAEWQLIKENSLKNMAVKWGMSPKILSSYLAQGTAQMTATQIDSEDDLSIAFINLHRSYFIDPINELLETTLNFYGKETNVEISFASPSLINKDRMLDRVTRALEAGLMDMDEAIRTLNPDLEEEKIQEKIQLAQQHQQEMMMQQMFEMQQSGGFGNNYDDLGGENLNGSTSPDQ